MIDREFPIIPWVCRIEEAWRLGRRDYFVQARWQYCQVSVWCHRFPRLRALLAITTFRLWKHDSRKPMGRLYMWLRCL